MKWIKWAVVVIVIFSLLFVFTPVSNREWANLSTKGGLVLFHATASPSYDVFGCGMLYGVWARAYFGGQEPRNATGPYAEWICGPPFPYATPTNITGP